MAEEVGGGGAKGGAGRVVASPAKGQAVTQQAAEEAHSLICDGSGQAAETHLWCPCIELHLAGDGRMFQPGHIHSFSCSFLAESLQTCC